MCMSLIFSVVSGTRGTGPAAERSAGMCREPPSGARRRSRDTVGFALTYRLGAPNTSESVFDSAARLAGGVAAWTNEGRPPP
jgi:hypothetical protein